jgi:phage replication O-like protein O
MANPQPDKYTRISNELMEQLPFFKFNGTQLRLLLIVIRFTYGFCRKEWELSLKFLSNATGLHKEQVKRELNTLIAGNVITVIKAASFNQTRVLALNKDYDKWSIERSDLISLQGTNSFTGSENGYLQEADSFTPTGSELDPQERKYKENIKESIYIQVFDFWNSKNIIKHKKLTDKIKRKISGTTADYTIDEIMKAISNYEIVLHGDKYYWSHTWTLEEFLQRGLEKFLTDACFENYLKGKGGKENGDNARGNTEHAEYAKIGFNL